MIMRDRNVSSNYLRDLRHPQKPLICRVSKQEDLARLTCQIRILIPSIEKESYEDSQ